MKAFLQGLTIVAVAALLSLASFYLRPNVFPWDISEFELDLETALAMEDALWVDARVDADYAAGHFPGAVSLNEENWEQGFAPLLEMWTPERPIVVYCSSQSCLRSHYVAERLRHDLQMDEIYALRDGWESLVAAGLVENEG